MQSFFDKMKIWAQAHRAMLGRTAIGTVLLLLAAWLLAVYVTHNYWAVVLLLAVFVLLGVLVRQQYRQGRKRVAQTRMERIVPETMERPRSVSPSIVTVRSGYLHSDELAKVLYDEPHHWAVTLVMFFDPFWGTKHDVEPEMTERVRAAIDSRTDGMVMQVLRMTIQALQFVMAATGLAALYHAAGLVFVVTGHHMPTPWFGPGWGLLLVVAVVLIQILWGRYISRVAQRCRFVLTDDKAYWIVEQLPWRKSGGAVIRRAKFDGFFESTSLLGRIFGFADFIIRTTEQEERIPAWIRARLPQELKLVFRWWEYLSEKGSKHRTTLVVDEDIQTD